MQNLWQCVEFGKRIVRFRPHHVLAVKKRMQAMLLKASVRSETWRALVEQTGLLLMGSLEQHTFRREPIDV